MMSSRQYWDWNGHHTFEFVQAVLQCCEEDDSGSFFQEE